MYTGTYYHSIEAKGRISVPAKFRATLGDVVVVTRGLDGCLFLYRQDDWMSFISQLQDSLITKKTHRDFVRLMLNEAVELSIDDLGRILLPDPLRKKVSLSKDIVFAGSLDHIELWNRSQYHTYMDALEQRAEEVAESYGEPTKEDSHV